MSFSYDNFIRPLTTSDRTLKIYGDDGIVVYTINAFSVKSISVYANNLRINLHSDRLITINFSSNNEAKMAIGKLRTALDILQNKEPLFISKEIQEYVTNNVFGPTGAHGDVGEPGPQGDAGDSAYEVWRNEGNFGSVDAFFQDLSGTSGLADRYNGTSSNEIVIPSQGTVVSFDTQTQLAFVPGQHVYLYNDLSTNYYLIDDYVEDLTSVYILGEVDAYDRVTGSMSIVTIESQPIGGTYSMWYLALTGQQGVMGLTGSDGTQGTSGTSGRSGFGSLSSWNASESPNVSGNFAISSISGTTTFDINAIDIFGVDHTNMFNTIIGMITTGQPIIFNITNGTLLASFYLETGSLGLEYFSFSGTTINSDILPGPDMPYNVSYNIAGINGTSGTSGIDGTSGTSGIDGRTFYQDAYAYYRGYSIGDIVKWDNIFYRNITGANGNAFPVTEDTTNWELFVNPNGTSGTSGIDGTSGTSGAQGPVGPQGQSSNLFYYKGSTASISGNPGAGYLTWDSYGQTSSTSLNINMSEEDGTDIDIFLGLIIIGQQIVIQDRALSDNYQTWEVSATPTRVVGVTNYWIVPVILTDSAGTGLTNFLDNNQLFLGIFNASGTSGTSGSTGTSGSMGTAGTSGSMGTAGTSGSTGTSGSMGTAGTSGSMGTAGTSGTTPTGDLSLSGNLTVSGTASLNGLTVLGETSEILNNYGATASNVTYDFNTGAIWYHGTASTNYIANFTNLPTTNNRALTATIMINQGSTGYSPTIVRIDGATQSVKWSGGTYSVSTNKVDVVGFTFIRTGSVWAQVFGQISSFS